MDVNVLFHLDEILNTPLSWELFERIAWVFGIAAFGLWHGFLLGFRMGRERGAREMHDFCNELDKLKK
jgi:hypothetical protein